MRSMLEIKSNNVWLAIPDDYVDDAKDNIVASQNQYSSNA